MGQSTIYYQQEKIVNKNTQQSTSGKHHKAGMFLTFNQQGCYDSDRNGYDVGNGFREKVGQRNGLSFYKGDSFWGKNTKYTVNQDKSRINIEINGKVYVYVRSQAPQGVQTCSLIKQASTGTGNTVALPIAPNNITLPDNKTNNYGNATYYQTRYNQMEQSLKNDINTFERTMSGSYNSSRSMMATAIRQAQQNMRDWRNTAAQNGVQITPSPWENVQVSIGTIHYEEKY